MFIIVGLGNPGKEFEYTRHNIGFRVVDFFAEQNNFPEFKLSKKYNALLTEGVLGNVNVILVKPQTFMNLSGKTVRSIIDFYKLDAKKDLIVVGDDADVLIGEIKIQKGKASAGHKGVQSIIDELGMKDFTRIRIGIDSDDPAYKIPVSENGLESVVLKNFTESEEYILKNVISEASEHIKNIIENGF
ncbi:MAG: aminoacyl-tRNA hydrolase [Candidatus Pacebacteria bacterium]|nr:aminoacyl-tRNA hydrolase [Candidatus Paceibacterota bacterium]